MAVFCSAVSGRADLRIISTCSRAAIQHGQFSEDLAWLKNAQDAFSPIFRFPYNFQPSAQHGIHFLALAALQDYVLASWQAAPFRMPGQFFQFLRTEFAKQRAAGEQASLVHGVLLQISSVAITGVWSEGRSCRRGSLSISQARQCFASS